MSLPAPEARPPRARRPSRRVALGVLGATVVGAVSAALLWLAARPPVVAVVAAADSDVHVDGRLVGNGAKVRSGSRVLAAKGDALVLMEGGKSALLREGAVLALGDDPGQVGLERGRVRFEVRARPHAPNAFRVDAGLAFAQVLGTIFVVERRPTDERVLVSVQEGRVRVTGLKTERLLDAGEETTVVNGRVGAVRPLAGGALREDSQPGLLERLRKRAGRLIDDWGP